VQVAIWLVDNPWHVLSGLKAPFWKQADLFVTDASFIPGLQRHGAERVRHLPLAVCRHWAAQPHRPQPDLAGRLVFVGRSEFPSKAGFFAGCRVDPALWRRAASGVEAGPASEMPDFFWWVRELGLERLWPGRNVRLAGFGAEEAARLRRTRYLRAAATAAPTIVYGDAGWDAQALGPVQRREPVDYYGPLASIYKDAAFTLNVTSLLLPAGLTQRHFDVWAADGFLLSDATPGLSIFPKELAETIAVARPAGLVERIETLQNDPDLRRDLAGAWRALVLAEHTYDNRVARVLTSLPRK
jgi:hypothetical protein